MAEEKGLAIRQPGIIQSFDDVERAAQALSKSGYFQDAREIAQCVTKILAGRELGFGPFASMNGIHIIQGRPSIGANLMAAAVKGSGRYNYRVTEMSDKVCTIDYYEGREKIGTSSFSIEDARKAQTKNLDKFARNMLFARAMSNGVRWFCPDVFNGSAVYTPEELGAEVNEDGDVIAGQFTPAPEPTNTTPEVPPTPEQLLKMALETNHPKGGKLGAYTLDDLHRMIASIDTARAEGKTLKQVYDTAYPAAKLIIESREKEATA